MIDSLRYQAGEGVPPEWVTIKDDKEKYQAYLCSREWAEKRVAVLARAHYVCERCEMHEAFAIHHKTYARKFNEDLCDLIALCHGCHEYTHGKNDKDPIDERYAHRTTPRAIVGIGPKEVLGYDSLVSCPYCGSENVHMHGVKWEAGNQGRMIVSMWCESSCTWEMVFEGHKGTMRAWNQNWKEMIDA